ncbi:dephospho-CoA kinase [Mariprofundus sp. EBB-1]|nr:dephospho-CoA kinase [Mariprofundus sp. EBB-1]
MIASVGLTGGIGSGKSSVAKIFAEMGVPVLDLDQVGRDVVAVGSTGLEQLTKAFGDAILNSDGSLNRASLAEHCFADATETARLNSIMHPLIRDQEDVWLQQQHGSYAIIEASVLLESGGVSRMDAVLVVMADLALRRARVIARGDRNNTQFDAIVARQCSDELRRESADYIILNNDNFESLREKVIETHSFISKQFNA